MTNIENLVKLVLKNIDKLSEEDKEQAIEIVSQMSGETKETIVKGWPYIIEKYIERPQQHWYTPNYLYKIGDTTSNISGLLG